MTQFDDQAKNAFIDGDLQFAFQFGILNLECSDFPNTLINKTGIGNIEILNES